MHGDVFGFSAIIVRPLNVYTRGGGGDRRTARI
jgi:hypothetical protein